MRRLAASLVLLLICVSAPAFAQTQSLPQQIPANFLIPHPPPRAPLADWVDAPRRTCLSETVPGATLRGWQYRGSSPHAPIVLFFNGNGMVIDGSDALYRLFTLSGAEVVVFDYRGLGFSTGTPDMLAFRQDALALYDAVVRTHPGRAVAVYGFSLGTAMASYVASQRPVAGLILAGAIATAADEFPFYLRSVGFDASAIGRLAPGEDSVEVFNEVANVARSRAPLLMLHGEDDLLVPIDQGRKVFASSPATRKRFVALPNTNHTETPRAPEALHALTAFLTSLKH